MGYRPRVGASHPRRTQYSEWAPVGFFVSRILRGVKWEGPGSRPILSGEGAMDSRLRGNDGDGSGNDVDGGIDGGECRSDGKGAGMTETGAGMTFRGKYFPGAASGGMDSRLRGNDVVDGSGNGGDRGGSDGGGGCLRGRPSPRRLQAAVQSLQISQTQFLQAKLRVMVGRPMMSSKEKANFFLRFVLKSIRLHATPIPVPIAAAPYNIFCIFLTYYDT